jgi:flagellar hook-basal body complex protein FliE
MAVGAVAAQAALQAYRTAEAAGNGAAASASGGAAGGDFGKILSSAMQGMVDQGNQAETQSRAAIAGSGQSNLLDVVTAVEKAELSLQTTVAVRDRVVQAYQDIMHMAI